MEFVGFYLIIVLSVLPVVNKQICKPERKISQACIFYPILVCLQSISTLKIKLKITFLFHQRQYIRWQKTKHYARRVWHLSGQKHCYEICPSCDLPCFLDGQLWDITVTITKKMKWQEHPLHCMHACPAMNNTVSNRVFHTYTHSNL